MVAPTRRTKQQAVHEIATVTSKGQITIPKAVRDRVGLRPGDRLEFIEDSQGMRIKRHRRGDPLTKWHGYLKKLEGVDIDKMIAEMRGR